LSKSDNNKEIESKLTDSSKATLLSSPRIPQSYGDNTLSDQSNVSVENKQSHLNRRYRILKQRPSKCAVTVVLLNIIFLTISIILFSFCVKWRSRPAQCLDGKPLLSLKMDKKNNYSFEL